MIWLIKLILKDNKHHKNNTMINSEEKDNNENIKNDKNRIKLILINNEK